MCRGDGATVRVRLGITAGGTATRLDFGEERAKLLQAASVATADVFPLERLGLSASVGTSLGGRLDYRGERYELLPGPIGGVGASYRLLGGPIPFIHLGIGYSLARSTARAADNRRTAFTSRDFRLGLAVGKVFGGSVAPFVVARYFGGGTDWSVAGGKGADAFRYHAGVGTVLALSRQLDALLELTPLGERRVTLGIGYSL